MSSGAENNIWFWLTTTCITIVLVSATLYHYRKVRRANSAQIIAKCRDQINGAFSQASAAGDKLQEMYSNQTDRIAYLGVKASYIAALEAWLNAYEDACNYFLRGDISENDFRSFFAEEIINIFNNRNKIAQIKDMLGDGKSFPSLYRCYYLMQ